MLPPPLPEGPGAVPDPASGPACEQHVVLTVGRLAASERYKGHDAMLDAWPIVFGRIPAAAYWIIGDGDDRPRLEARARRNGGRRIGEVLWRAFRQGIESLL